MLLTIVIFLIILSLLVLVHELGHFLTARFFGVKVEEFGLGLPPRAIGWQKKDGRGKWTIGSREVPPGEPTVYSFNWILLGGFVKIKGENGEAEQDKDSFGHKTIWQRCLILAAGVTMNVLFCIALLSFGFMIGMPMVAGEAPGGTFVSPPQVEIASVLDGYPAKAGGLEAGDVILAVDQKPMASSVDLKSYLTTKDNQTVVIKIKLGQTSLDKSLTVVTKGGITGIGVSVADLGLVRYPWYLAIWRALQTTWFWLVTIVLAVVGLVRQLFGGASAGVEFSGPVGIAVMTGQAAKLGWIYVLQFAALLSLNLAIINILPIPALDGGRIFFLAIGKLRGKMVNSKWENLSHNIGYILLLLLIVVITGHDLYHYGGQIIAALRHLVGI